MAKKAIRAALPFPAVEFRQELLDFYHKNKRPLPWRENISPYRVWLSEVMLQQTTVTTVIPYYERFLERFPTLEALAAAREEEVFRLWQGLGYYSRARNLLACARGLVQQHNGQFPEDEKSLLALPGIGPYTAAAVRAMAFNLPASVLDGNVERVMSRLFAVPTSLPAAKPQLAALARALACPTHPADYANAIMELGATVCTPTSPRCDLCPTQRFCRALKEEQPEKFPIKTPRAPRPHKKGIAWCLLDGEGKIYLRRRPAKGLLAGLWEVPSEGWEAQGGASVSTCHKKARFSSRGTVRHMFTHFSLELEVQLATVPPQTGKNWFPREALPPLPTLMKKVLSQALAYQV